MEASENQANSQSHAEDLKQNIATIANVDTRQSAEVSADGSVLDADADIVTQLPTFQPQHRKLLRIGITIMLLILSVEWVYLVTRRPDPLLLDRGDVFRQQFRVEINSSSWVDWLQLDGIGPSMAHRIVADRKVNGPFKSIDEVTRVPGIGQTTLDRIRPWLTIHHEPNESKSADSSSHTVSDQPPAESEKQSSTL